MIFWRVALALIFVVAGLLHFFKTPMYMSIMPAYLPAHRSLVLVSGAAEVLGGLGLLLPSTQRWAAWGLIALLIAVFPANVQMALDYARWPGIPVWALWLRLPLQIPMIAWAWLYTKSVGR